MLREPIPTLRLPFVYFEWKVYDSFIDIPPVSVYNVTC